MKKTILLSALVASVASMAATTGSIEAYNKNETTYEKYDKVLNETPFPKGFKETKSTFGVKTEVKVNESGLSFGADLKAKDLTIFGEHKYVIEKDVIENGLPKTITENKKTYDSIIDHSSVWAKYELPELSGVMTYVKGTYKTVGEIAVEADASYKVAEDIKVGLNSETIFNVKAVTSGTTVTSTHKVYAKGNYSAVKDIEAELGFTHDYNEAKTAVKEVFLNAKASHDLMSDLKLTGKVDFAHALNGGSVSGDSLLKGKLSGTYRHSYLLSAVYTGVKDTEVKLDAFIEHNLQSATTAVLNFGFKPEIKYTGIENLVLSSKNVLGGTATYDFTKNTVATTGYVKLNANGEYTYKATDKLTIKPSLDITSHFYKITKDSFKSGLAITPKIAVEYKPVESLTLSGDVATSINFNSFNAKSEFQYKNTTVKSNFNVKYTW